MVVVVVANSIPNQHELHHSHGKKRATCVRQREKERERGDRVRGKSQRTDFFLILRRRLKFLIAFIKVIPIYKGIEDEEEHNNIIKSFPSTTEECAMRRNVV